MNKFTKFSYLVIAAMLMGIQAYSQSQEWVNQVIVVNNGRNEITPPYTDYVTVQSFNPTTHTVRVFDTIYSQKASDILIKDNKCWVATPDSIILYNIDTYQRLNAISDSGVNKMYIYQNQYLVISKRAPVTRFYVEILDLNSMTLAGLVDGISDQCAGITSEYDTVYVAINGGTYGTVGKLAVIHAPDFIKIREVDFGILGTGITDLYPFAGNIFTLNFSPTGANTGNVCAYNFYNGTFNMHNYNVRVGQGYGIKDNLLYMNFSGGVGSYNLSTQSIQDTIIIPDPSSTYRMSFLGGALDYVNSSLYMNLGTQVSPGLGYVTNLTGDSLTSFNEGINAFNVAIDFRTPSGISETKKGSDLILVSPNPAGNRFEIKYLGPGDVQQLSITDLTGRVAFTRNIEGPARSWVINDANLVSGMYILNVKTSQGMLTTKFLRQ